LGLYADAEEVLVVADHRCDVVVRRADGVCPEFGFGAVYLHNLLMRFTDSDYEPLKRPRKLARAEADVLDEGWLPAPERAVEPASPKKAETVPPAAKVRPPLVLWTRSQAHFFTFLTLILYTALAYFRPYELSPAFEWTRWLPYWVAIAMLAIFIPSQFASEGNITARPKEVKLALFLGLIAIISIPQAIDPALSWEVFYTLYVKTLIVFIVMVNALRTERRLRTMILLALVTGGVMSITALFDYSAGRTGIYAERANVAISNMFGEPNSLALHLVTMIPLALVLAIGSKNPLKKLLYFGGSLAMIAGVFATFSRGGFLGLCGAGFVLAWKLGRRNRFAIVGIVVIAVVAAMFLAPGGYGARVGSIINPMGDTSATARRALLTRSVWVALTSPFLGVGIGNLRVVLIHDQVSHNAYTQIAGDMGLIALALYVMLLVVPFRRLAAIERETMKEQHYSRYYYLAVGLQASLVGYMVGSFFLSVAYDWFGYFLVAYAVSFAALYYKHAAGDVAVQP
jgi:O-antigen ligase